MHFGIIFAKKGKSVQNIFILKMKFLFLVSNFEVATICGSPKSTGVNNIVPRNIFLFSSLNIPQPNLT